MDWLLNPIGFTDTRCERMWEHNGHVCAVFLQPNLWHRCGYVWVADGSPLHGKTYDDDIVHENLDVHGGVTFSGTLNVGDIDFDEPDQGGWAFGFDCAHAGDAPDIEAGRKRYGESNVLEYVERLARRVDPFTCCMPHIWTLDECCDETERLCDKIAELEHSRKF